MTHAYIYVYMLEFYKGWIMCTFVKELIDEVVVVFYSFSVHTPT
jgi:hypothetical protein